jgi:uncharacterized RDD family membrane protein YckC
MTQWYYASAGERLGPVDAQDLQARLERGELDGDTLVWREGMTDWQPVREVAAELAFATPAAVADAGVGVGAGADAGPSSFATPASPYAAPQASAYQPQAPVHAGDVVYAGFLKRYAAMTIDSVIMGVASMILVFVGMLLFGVGAALTPDNLRSGMLAPGLPLLFVLLALVSQAVYYVWMTSSSHQATLGKMAVGIKVVRSNGQTLGVGRSLARFAAYVLLPLVTCYVALPVSAFMSGLTARKQALHDMIVDSLVVDQWAFTAQPERQRRELGVITWVILVLALLGIVAYIGLLLVSLAMGVAAQQ